MDRSMTCSHAVLIAIVTAAMATGCAAPGGNAEMELLELNQKALEARERGDSAAARQAYRQLLDRDPERPQAWFELGKLSAAADDLQQARDAFARALEHDPEFHKARYNLGLVHMRLGSELLREARDAMPEDASTRATDVYLSCLLARTVRNPELEIPCPDLP